MKLVAIVLIDVSICWFVRIYLSNFKSRTVYLESWKKIFAVWKEWISKFSYSVDELIERTSADIRTKELDIAKSIENKQIQYILSEVKDNQTIAETDKQVIIEVLVNIGSSLIDGELNSLSVAINKLDDIVEKREKVFDERKKLAYKLTPLICGALIIILW